MHILVPCKNFNLGKTRLSKRLNPYARRKLCEWLLMRTLEKAVAAVGSTQVQVVTSDLDAAAIARRYCIGHISDPGGGLNFALEKARTILSTTTLSESGVLILPIDLPFASLEAISKMRSCAGDVVIAPDKHGTGTNSLLLRPAALRNFRLAFGSDSYAAHVAIAQASGLTINSFFDWRFAFDIDQPSQYEIWRSRSE